MFNQFRKWPDLRIWEKKKEGGEKGRRGERERREKKKGQRGRRKRKEEMEMRKAEGEEVSFSISSNIRWLE